MKTAIIPGYENRYLITETGEVWAAFRIERAKDGKLQVFEYKKMAVTIDKRNGYPQVKLTRPNGRYGNQHLHRLLAICFIPNPQDKPYVNHKNGNKADFRLENLEWVTASENQIHAIKTGLAKKPACKKVVVFDLCKETSYESITDASRKTRINRKKLAKLLKLETGCFRRAA